MSTAFDDTKDITERPPDRWKTMLDSTRTSVRLPVKSPGRDHEQRRTFRRSSTASAQSVGIPPFRGGIVYEESPCQRHGGSTTAEFREGAVRIVRETGKPIAEVARDLGINAGTLGNWVDRDRLERGEEADRSRVDPGSVRQLERENAELRMERDVLKRSVVLWVKEATQ